MRILVTGASGLLGINLALEAAKKHEVYGLVNHQQLKPDTFQVLQADLLVPGALEEIIDRTQPDWIIHCAALAVVDSCETDPQRAHQTNTVIPAKLASLTGNVTRGGARLLHISTDAVFDGNRGDYREEDEPNPLSIYARTKLAAEREVLARDPQALVARVSLFGWSISTRRALSEFFYNNLRAGNQVKGFTDIYFCPLLANDLARLLLEMLELGLAGLYHVFSREGISKYEFGVRLARKFGLDESLITPVTLTEGDLKATRSPYLVMNTAKLTAALGRQPPSVDEGLQGLWELEQKGYREMLRSLGRTNL
jgi:dTDP-4-dehydrorhamnose reductase